MLSFDNGNDIGIQYRNDIEIQYRNDVGILCRNDVGFQYRIGLTFRYSSDTDPVSVSDIVPTLTCRLPTSERHCSNTGTPLGYIDEIEPQMCENVMENFIRRAWSYKPRRGGHMNDIVFYYYLPLLNEIKIT